MAWSFWNNFYDHVPMPCCFPAAFQVWQVRFARYWSDDTTISREQTEWNRKSDSKTARSSESTPDRVLLNNNIKPSYQTQARLFQGKSMDWHFCSVLHFSENTEGVDGQERQTWIWWKFSAKRYHIFWRIRNRYQHWYQFLCQYKPLISIIILILASDL